jgi:hypothetical protein
MKCIEYLYFKPTKTSKIYFFKFLNACPLLARWAMGLKQHLKEDFLLKKCVQFDYKNLVIGEAHYPQGR